MKNWVIVLISLAIVTCSTEQKETTSQEKGVNFKQTDLSEIFAQAEKLQKLVMIDVYSDG